MNTITMIITPISGAIIGYFTNWLAIKMLFRPHSEKKLLGIKLPFTPGLIPKGRYALSKKIGETVSQNVLTDEVLNSSINSPEINAKIDSLIDENLTRFADKDITLKSIISPGGNAGRFDSVLGFAGNKISESVINALTDEKFIKKAADMITENIVQLLKNQEGMKKLIAETEVFDKLNTFLKSKGIAYIGSYDFEVLIADLLSSLVEKIGKQSVSELFKNDHGAVADKTQKISFFLMDKSVELIDTLADNNPQLDNSLRELVEKIASENIGKLVGFFVNYGKIYDNIKKGVSQYLSDPANKLVLKDKTNTFIETWLNKDLEEIAAKLPEDLTSELPAKLTELIRNSFSEELIDKVMSFGLEKSELMLSQDYYGMIEKLFPDFEISLNRFAVKKLTQLANDNSEKIAGFASQKVVGYLTNFNISELYRKLDDDKKTQLKALIKSFAVYLLKNGGAYIVDNLDMGSIIERKINEFEMDKAEDLIMSVVKKELSAITVLGGVLGFVIGFVPVILELLGLS